MAKKLSAFLLALILVCGSLQSVLPDSAVTVHAATGTDSTEYTYEVIPLLEPFNVYFYVKTENPDPNSFRFADHDSIYANDGKPGLIELYKSYVFADVVYEDAETLRVKGGYIFWSGYTDTDGGVITMQTPTYDYWGRVTGWQDTDVTLTIPTLCDDIDYLIDNFSKGDSFFEKMDAIQAGLSSICLYSGNYIRGELYRARSYWYMYRSPYIDQTYYIGSPYSRGDNRSLFATALYPLIRDSIGFPSTMGSVARRLDEAATYKWSSTSHALVEVTYDGETRTYGGQGNGMGQGISKENITKFFAFGEEAMDISLESLKKLHTEYSQVVMEDDIPHDDELTWKIVNDTVGENGAWALFTNGYAYLYKKDDKDSYSTMAAGNAGGSLYWGGSLGYAKNAWIDGRHVSKWSMYDQGATFEEYPTDAIILTNVVYPVFTYKLSYAYDWATGTYQYIYSNVTVTEHTGLLQYTYNATDNAWDSSLQNYNSEERIWEYSDYKTAVTLAENGLIDEKYVDMLRLTYDEVLALDVDRNTDLEPDRGYNYSGTTEAGTPFDRSAINTEDLSFLFADAKAIAEENELEFSLEEGYYGMCGDSMYWVYLQDSQALIITGTGDMATLGDSPWYFGALPIKQLFVGEGVESLQDQAFYVCTTLETASLPSTLKKIGQEAFRHCSSLKEIVLPSGLTTVGEDAFKYCSGMTDIYCEAEAQPESWSENWLGDCKATVHWGHCAHKQTTTDRKEATCTEVGYEDIVCDNCGETLSHTELPMTEHAYGEWTETKAPTCAEAGAEERSCEVCGKKETRAKETTRHLHTTTDRKEVTCTEAGYEDVVCVDCGEVVSHVILPALEHLYENGVCTRCGEEEAANVLLGDVNGDGVVNGLDRMMLDRYLAEWEEYQDIDLKAADVNKDGVVNNLDRMILTRHLAEWEDYATLPHVE